MSAYELSREENIRRNKALIKDLGLSSLTAPKKPTRRGRPQGTKRKVDATPTRSSARIAAAPPKQTYNEPDSTPSGRRSERVARRPLKRSREAASPGLKLESLSPSASPSPEPELEDMVKSWTAWKPTAPAPQRDEDGTLHFASHPTFTPNKTPAEMLREGAFGGCFYRPYRSLKLKIVIQDDWRELPQEWIEGLDVARYLTGGESGEYNPEVNKHGVKAGQSLEDWEKAGWMNHRFDARGWFQWYTRFFMGRRCEDDERQVGRWERCVGKKGRWRRVLLKQYVARGIRSVMDEEGGEGGVGGDVSAVVTQTGLQWAWEIKQNELDDVWSNGI